MMMNKGSMLSLLRRAFLGLTPGIFFQTHAAPPTMLVPVNVYCYSFAAAPELNCTQGRDEINTLISNVNRIWAQAGIEWNLESVIARSVSANDFPPLTGNENGPEIRKRLIAASPHDEGKRQIFKIAVIRKFPVQHGGVYNPETRTIYVSERRPTAQAAVLAHELGHSLGLPHADQPGNLMYVKRRDIKHGDEPGNTPNKSPPADKLRLTEQQIAAARAQATKGPADMADMSGPAGQPTRRPGGSLQRNGVPGGNTETDPAKRRERFANRLRSFDRDGDGVIQQDDIPAPASSMFDRVDRNQDGKIDAAELDEFQQGSTLRSDFVP